MEATAAGISTMYCKPLHSLLIHIAPLSNIATIETLRTPATAFLSLFYIFSALQSCSLDNSTVTCPQSQTLPHNTPSQTIEGTCRTSLHPTRRTLPDETIAKLSTALTIVLTASTAPIVLLTMMIVAKVLDCVSDLSSTLIDRPSFNSPCSASYNVVPPPVWLPLLNFSRTAFDDGGTGHASHIHLKSAFQCRGACCGRRGSCVCWRSGCRFVGLLVSNSLGLIELSGRISIDQLGRST